MSPLPSPIKGPRNNGLELPVHLEDNAAPLAPQADTGWQSGRMEAVPGQVSTLRECSKQTMHYLRNGRMSIRRGTQALTGHRP